jgi:hypothetical protein
LQFHAAAPFLLRGRTTISDGDSNHHEDNRTENRRAERAGRRFAPPSGIPMSLQA